MSWQIWWLFVCGVFVICATPGPNMLHVMSRSQKFGYRRSMAAMAGCLSAILLAQPLVYMALGFCWAFTAFGRLVSMLSDGGGRLYNLALFVVEAVLAALPLLFAFGLVS